jgi:heptosyltransferase-2
MKVINTRIDCKYFLGYKPCQFKRECDGCTLYEPQGTRILIIKLGAMGDVLRTTTLLHGLRQKYPRSYITWLTEANIAPLLKGTGYVDRLLTYNFESVMQLRQEHFDIAMCFDKEPKATALINEVKASRKVGFGMSQYGNVIPLNQESVYTYNLGISDELKFRLNQKTYQELIYECVDLPFDKSYEYIFPDLTEETRWAEEYLTGLGGRAGHLKVGLNTGCGDVFATKKWTVEGFVGLSERLIEHLSAQVLLLGGPAEEERNTLIRQMVKGPVIDTGSHNTLRQFTGIINNCDVVVTGDTLGMHLAIGLKKPVVVLLGPTCHQEIELYGRGVKLVTDFECSPCYLQVCPYDITCMQAMPVDLVYQGVLQALRQQSPIETRFP